MNLYVTALNSGSNGNCYYVGNEEEAVLIDAGISCRETEQRMKRLELSMKKVKAIFISHEHTDHVKGVRVLSKKYNLPVYITQGTLLKTYSLKFESHLNVRLYPYKPVQVGSLTVTAFPKMHDAYDPHSFTVESGEVSVGVFTDIGAPCEHVIRNFKRCHAIFLETNYDTDMLMKGAYPYYLKQRISSEKGHLSNQQALDLFLEHKPSFMSHIFLSHISKENNDPQLVYELFKAHADGVEVVLTSRMEEIPVYKIGKEKNTNAKFSILNSNQVHSKCLD